MIAVLAEGAGILLAGILLGRSWRPRRRAPKPVQPVCGCDHDVSFHEGHAGPCHGVHGYYHTRCTCQRYSGPVPLPEFYAQEIGGN